MFVFPAFNESYNKRKRTYKCCRKCRSRRVRCNIKSSDYDVTGCENCRESNILCDLIKRHGPESGDSPGMSAMAAGVTDVEQAPHHSFEKSELSPDVKRQRRDSRLTHESDTSDKQYESQSTHSQHSGQQGAQSVPPQSVPLTQMHSEINYSTPPGIYPPYQPPLQMPPGQMGTHHVPMFVPMPQPSGIQPPPPQMSQMAPMVPISHVVPPPISYGSSNIPQVPIFQQQPPPPPPPFSYGTEHGSGGPGGSGFPPYDYNSRPGEPLIATSSKDTQTGASNAGNFGSTREPSVKQDPPSSSNEDVRSERTVDSTADSDISEKILDANLLKKKYGFNVSHNSSNTANIPTYKEVDYTTVKRTDVSAKEKNVMKNRATYEYLKAIDAFTLRDQDFMITSSQEVLLLGLYFREVNDVFMVVDEQTFWKQYQKNEASSYLIYAIILTIIKYESARPIVTEIIGSEDFRDKLEHVSYSIERKIRQLLLILPELGDEEKMTRSVVFCLLSMNFSPTKYGNEQSSQDLHSAIGLAFSMLIHMGFVHEKLKSQGLHNKQQYYAKFWWTLYIFDRFNGIVNTKAFMIKQEDFSVEETDDEKFNEIIIVTKRLEEVIFLIYQPKSDKTFQRVKEYAAILQQAIRQGSRDIQANSGLDVRRDLLKYMVNNLVMIIMNTLSLRASGRQHVFDHIHSNCCANVLTSIDKAGGLGMILHIPIVPSTVSLCLSVMLKYKIKIIYLYKLNQLHSRKDLNYQRIELFHSMFDGLYSTLDKHFKSWWFVKEILRNMRYLVNGYNKKYNTNNSYQSNLVKIREMVPLEPSDYEAANQPTGKTTDKSDKLRIKSLISSEDVLPPVVSISSPAYYATHIVKSEFLSDAQKQLRDKGIPTDLSEQVETNEEPERNFEVQQPVKLEGNQVQYPFNSGNSTPTTSISDGVQGEMFDLPSDLLDVENNRLLEYLNDDLFNNPNLAEFVTQDPSLRGFFTGLQ